MGIKNKNMKIKIHTKRLPRRNDSMFYYGKHIATLTKGDVKLYVESAGEMKAAFKENGECYSNEDLAKQLKKRRTTDRGLSAIGVRDLILNNNWLRIINETSGGDEMGICGTYDDAIEYAKFILEKA